MSDSPIASTLLSHETFDDIFTEIDHGRSLNLLNPNELRIFHLDMLNNEFNFSPLSEFLEENIGSYVFSRVKIDNLYAAKKERSINSRAWKEMNSLTTNNLSEILLYVFLEHVLQAPKLLSKVELATSGRVSNSDSVHLKTLEDSNGTYYQMVFGVSHIIGDLRDAIDTAYKAIRDINASQQEEIQLVDKTVLGQSFDDETTQKIKEILIPSKNNSSNLENAFGIFLGYSLGLNTASRPTRQFNIDAEAKMKADITAHVDYIVDAINNSGLSNYSFYIYVMPFNNASIDSEDIMNEILPRRTN
ncbi:DUF1837 domain-containing protein [Enterococcus faecalis]|uniref:HamA C-terminal domain-containing protein n=1 Tax=Enterococcus faecalis TaxID=1351 RepID=UPI0039A4DEE0